MSREPVIAQLLSTLHETTALYDQPDSALNRSYAPGKWKMREILIHLSDSEAVLLDRLRRLAAEEKPMLMAFDENKWAAGLQYKKRDLSTAKAQYEAARRSIIELARLLDAKTDANAGTHSEAGTRTFGQILGQVVEHNAHHLEQLRAIVENRSWAPQK